MTTKGFTLIELLVVVLIIGILAAIALPQYQRAALKAKTREPLMNIKSIGDAQQRYKLATGSYAPDLSVLDITLPAKPQSLCGNYTTNAIYAHTVCSWNNTTFYIADYYAEPAYVYCSAATSNNDGIEICKMLSNNATPRQDMGSAGYTQYLME